MPYERLIRLDCDSPDCDESTLIPQDSDAAIGAAKAEGWEVVCEPDERISCPDCVSPTMTIADLITAADHDHEHSTRVAVDTIEANGDTARHFLAAGAASFRYTSERETVFVIEVEVDTRTVPPQPSPLEKALSLHQEWLDDRTKGERFVGAAHELFGADLSGAVLRLADLSRSDMRTANLSMADLVGADMRGAELGEADFSGANLYHAMLGGADLFGAVLREANLHRANLREVDLSETDLTLADISGAYLAGACLAGACLAGTVMDNP